MGSFMNFPRVWYLIMRPEEIQALHILRERACKMLFNFSFFSSFIIVGFSTGATYTLLDFQVTCNVSIGKCCSEQVFARLSFGGIFRLRQHEAKSLSFVTQCSFSQCWVVLGFKMFTRFAVDIVFEVSMSRNAFGQSRDDDSK